MMLTPDYITISQSEGCSQADFTLYNLTPKVAFENMLLKKKQQPTKLILHSSP